MIPAHPSSLILTAAIGASWVAALLVLHGWSRELSQGRLQSSTPRAPGQAAAAALVSRRIELAAWMLTAGFILGYAAMYITRRPGLPAWILLCTAGALVLAWSIANMRRLAGVIEMLRRRRDGQTLVGEHLERAMPSEFRAFHDVQLYDDIIDHVVAGPTGVFAIESWPRCRETAETESHERAVRYDGRKVYFDGRPATGDARDLNTARRKARLLKEWIAVETREYVGVGPVLVLAGWRIHADAGVSAAEKGSVRVLDEAGLGALSEGERILQPGTVHRIIGRLEAAPATRKPSRTPGNREVRTLESCNAADMC